MKVTKKAGQVLKGEIILIKGLRWYVDRVSELNKSVLFFELSYPEKNGRRFMGHARHKDRDIVWIKRK